jgi:hypothetical protein
MILKPGSIRPVKKISAEHGPGGFPNRSYSVYSEKGSRKRFSIIKCIIAHKSR